MKLAIFSDLHLEFAPFVPPETDADVIILAGDVHIRRNGVGWARDAFPQRPVLYVPGNHEYYGEAIPRHTGKLKALAGETAVQVLESDSIEIGGVLFLGTTLWTDFRLLGDPRLAGYHATQELTDYRRIRISPAFRKLRSIDTANLHLRSRNWLSRELARAVGKQVVVVTHHAPSARSLPLNHEADILNAAYASHMDDFVAESNAALWVHGHVHRRQDYWIGDTRVVCNPRGYPTESTGFDPGFVIEI